MVNIRPYLIKEENIMKKSWKVNSFALLNELTALLNIQFQNEELKIQMHNTSLKTIHTNLFNQPVTNKGNKNSSKYNTVVFDTRLSILTHWMNWFLYQLCHPSKITFHIDHVFFTFT